MKNGLLLAATVYLQMKLLFVCCLWDIGACNQEGFHLP